MGVYFVVLTHPDLPEERQVTCQADNKRHAVALAKEQDRKLSELHNTPRYVLASVERIDKPRRWWQRRK